MTEKGLCVDFYPSRRLRTVGILYGLAFHYVLGLAGFHNFSMTRVALYAAFLPAGFGRELARRRASGVRGRRLLGWAASLLGLWLLIFLAVVAALAARGLARDPRWLVHAAGYALWVIYGPLLAGGYLVVTARLTGDAGPASDRIAPRRAWHAVTFGLILVNGLSPYVGLKTEAAFSMYSEASPRTGHPVAWANRLLVFRPVTAACRH